MKKKAISVFLAAFMIFGLTACGSEAPAEKSSEEKSEETAGESSAESGEIESDEDETLLGGWEEAASPVVSDEVKSLLDKALEETMGADYIPSALLETQVVAGTNYRLLCRKSVTSPAAEETYAYVTFYADPDGNASLLDIVDTGVKTDISEEAAGAYEASESPELTENAQEAFEQAAEGMTGVSYEPLALLATQVVAGTNYRILCRSQVVYPGAESTYSLVTVYEDTEGKSEILDIQELKTEEAEDSSTEDGKE